MHFVRPLDISHACLIVDRLIPLCAHVQCVLNTQVLLNGLDHSDETVSKKKIFLPCSEVIQVHSLYFQLEARQC